LTAGVIALLLAQDYDSPGDSVADLTRRVRPLDLLENRTTTAATTNPRASIRAPAYSFVSLIAGLVRLTRAWSPRRGR